MACLTTKRSAQSVVFGDAYFDNACGAVHRLLHTIEDEAREILPRRHEGAVGEVSYFEIDVAMIEALDDLAFEDRIELREIYDEACDWIDVAGDCYVADV